MPVKGPDRRFMALVAYLGGRFHVCGEKWYGSNIANRERTSPLHPDHSAERPGYRGSHRVPLCQRPELYPDRGNPAVGARYFAKNNTKVLSEIGAGVIGRACVAALMVVLKQVEEIRIYDINQDAAQKYCQELSETYGVRAVAVGGVEERRSVGPM